MDKWLRNTNVVRILALCIGILLWVVVQMDIESTTPSSNPAAVRTNTISNVMVQPIYDENQYSIVSIEPSEVTVVLRGRDADLRKVTNLQVRLDLTNQGAGTFYMELKPYGDLPSGVSVEFIPSQVKVVLEEKQIKEIPVKINVIGTPAAGFKAGEPIVNPSRVWVTVPASQLDAVEYAVGEVLIDQATSRVKKQVKLTVMDKNGNEVKASASPPAVDVEVPVTAPIKMLPLQIQWIGEPARGYAVASVQQTAEQVAVYGPQDILDQMDYFAGPKIDLTGLTEDKWFSVELPLPQDGLKVEPAKVDVKVTVVPAVAKTIPNIPLTISGQNEGVIVNVVNPEHGVLSVVFEGAPDLMDDLNAQDIRATINVSDLTPGRHIIPVQFSLPPHIKLVDGPIRATVDISLRQREPSPNPTPAEPADTTPAGPSPTAGGEEPSAPGETPGAEPMPGEGSSALTET